MSSWFKSLSIIFLVLAAGLAQGWTHPVGAFAPPQTGGQLSVPADDTDALVPEPVRLVFAAQSDDTGPGDRLDGHFDTPAIALAVHARCETTPSRRLPPHPCLASASTPRAPPLT